MCPSGYHYSGGYCYRNSGWYWWGRWVFAGVVIVFILAVIVLLGCLSNRRRRRQGLAPRYGTGWLGPKFGPGYQNNANYNSYQQPPPPPPQYSQQPQYTGTTYNPNEGYWGPPQQQQGIALQQPQNSYYPRGGDNDYEPPAGAPPAKR
jgi:hypothetical protein